jgi:hypothetical protein
MPRGLPHGDTVDSYLRKQFTWARDGRGGEVIASSLVGTVWYCAYRNIIGSDKSEVTALVVLTARRRGEFGYKDMSESMGPNETKCPLHILNLLSPAEQIGHYAADWRQRCRDYAQTKSAARKNRPNVGDTIMYAEPLKYSGRQFQTFVVQPTPRGRRGLVGLSTNGTLCRLPTDERLATAKITRSA